MHRLLAICPKHLVLKSSSLGRVAIHSVDSDLVAKDCEGFVDTAAHLSVVQLTISKRRLLMISVLRKVRSMAPRMVPW